MNELKKNKVGRPRKEVKEKKVRMAYVSDTDYSFYHSFGGGNFSKGLHDVKSILEKLLKAS